ncbi:MAG: phosphoadenylyl-sulfate reductase [Flammeovirgaceae bacterium]|nr:phosphoadenylyl-sulfate reductase [Flammeovirgaceae bacterium]MBE61916.1 phosphoadenylyl-sulfate reductase [Flammeovirgaceae bacterium]|tara:strand:+ start:1856 stop:2512 length:657 start_codon:yes stop_codon:yes gene_type:complete
MEIPQIQKKLEVYKAEGKKLFTTSSFQTHSLVMLHIISRIDNSIPVYFLNTGYHFPETVAFKDQVAEQFGLNVIETKSSMPRYMQRDEEGRLLFTSDPDHCCFINKTAPTEELLKTHDVWINGVRGDQSAIRKAMKVEQDAPFNTVRFHPMLDWNMKTIFAYIKEHNLPRHPLDSKGYMSIGCEPCTRKMDPEMQEREARWFGLNKVECGLHTDLVKK